MAIGVLIGILTRSKWLETSCPRLQAEFFPHRTQSANRLWVRFQRRESIPGHRGFIVGPFPNDVGVEGHLDHNAGHTGLWAGGKQP